MSSEGGKEEPGQAPDKLENSPSRPPRPSTSPSLIDDPSRINPNSETSVKPLQSRPSKPLPVPPKASASRTNSTASPDPRPTLSRNNTNENPMTLTAILDEIAPLPEQPQKPAPALFGEQTIADLLGEVLSLQESPRNEPEKIDPIESSELPTPTPISSSPSLDTIKTQTQNNPSKSPPERPQTAPSATVVISNPRPSQAVPPRPALPPPSAVPITDGETPRMIFMRTLFDEYDISPLTIPDIYQPNYNLLGFNYTPEMETIGTRLRLLTLLADDDDLLEKFDVSESPLNYRDYSSVTSPYVMPITSFPKAPIPYQNPAVAAAQAQVPSTTPIVNPALASSFSNLKKLFASSPTTSSSNLNASGQSASRNTLAVNTPSSKASKGKLLEMKPTESPPTPPKTPLQSSQGVQKSNSVKSLPQQVQPSSSSPNLQVQPASASKSSPPSPSTPVASPSPQIAAAPTNPAATAIPLKLVVKDSTEYQVRKSRRNAAAINPKDVVRTPSLELELEKPYRATPETSAPPVVVEPTAPPSISVESAPEIPSIQVDSNTTTNTTAPVASTSGGLGAPQDPKSYRFTVLLKNPLGAMEEEVIRRHRGASLAEDQLLEKLNDFGDLELDLGFDDLKTNQSPEDPTNTNIS